MQAFSQVENKYDYISLDCPPNLYLMTKNALFASDWYVVTVIPEYLSVIGLQILTRKVNHIMSEINKIAKLTHKNTENVPNFGGVIFLKVRVGGSIVTTQHVTQMQNVRRREPDKCFEYYTTELIGYSEAAEQRVPIWLADTPNARRAANKREY